MTQTLSIPQMYDDILYCSMRYCNFQELCACRIVSKQWCAAADDCLNEIRRIVLWTKATKMFFVPTKYCSIALLWNMFGVGDYDVMNKYVDRIIFVEECHYAIMTCTDTVSGDIVKICITTKKSPTKNMCVIGATKTVMNLLAYRYVTDTSQIPKNIAYGYYDSSKGICILVDVDNYHVMFLVQTIEETDKSRVKIAVLRNGQRHKFFHMEMHMQFRIDHEYFLLNNNLLYNRVEDKLYTYTRKDIDEYFTAKKKTCCCVQ